MTPSDGPASASAITLELLPELGELDRISAAVRRLLSGPGIAREDAHLVDLALTEAFSNVLEHAIKDPDREPQITLDLSLDGGIFTCRLADNGGPSDISGPQWPEEHAESGRGVAVIVGAMDDVRFTREGSRNVLAMRKALS